MAVVFCCKFVRIYQRNLWSTTITLVKVFLWNSIYTKKCLVTCYYNSHRSNIPKHLNIVSKTLNFLPPKYSYILLGDECDAEWNEVPMVTFCKYYNLVNLIKQPTCFKNPEKPTCIDPILTNKPRSFQNKFVVERQK